MQKTVVTIFSRWVALGCQCLLLALALMASRGSLAATCTSIADGNWNTAGIWSGCTLAGNAPPADATVIINSVVTVNVNSALVGSVTINSGKTLRVASGMTLTLNGNFTKTGTFTASSTYPGTVAFVGSSQKISAATTFYNMSVGGATALTLGGNVKVSKVMTGTPTLTTTCPTDYTLSNGATTLHSCIPSCSAYRGQATLNEARIGAGNSSSASNQVEIFNSGNVASTLWKTWKVKVSYKSSATGTPTVKGPYPLSSGFTNIGQFIYNTTSMYLRNRSSSYVDIALVDSNGDFIDYVAITGVVQAVPPCFTSTVVTASSSSDLVGDLARLPDGGAWPAKVINSSAHTISRTNVCTATGNDVAVVHGVDFSSPILNTTQVTYTVTVYNKSCSTSATGLSLTDTGISTSSFSSLSYSPSAGTVTTPGASAPVWTIGTLAVGASATLTIVGTPTVLGTLVAKATVTGTSLINTSDDTASTTITVRDFNYVGFDVTTATVTEGVDASYTVTLSSDVPPSTGKPITVNYTVSGTADSNDTDLPASGSVIINPLDANGDPNTQAQVTFNIKDDDISEPSKSIIFTITGVSSSDGFAKIDTSTSTLTITLLDDDMPDLVAEYHLDAGPWTGQAAEIEDSSGSGFNGKATGSKGLPQPFSDTPALSGTTGTCGYASFGGATTTQAISMGAVDLGIGGDAGFSMSAWVRWGIDPATGNQWSNIVSNGNSGSGQFWLQHSQLNKNFEFAMKTSVTRNYVWSKTAPVAGQWYHVTGVYDGAALHIYVNGVLDDTANVALTGAVTPFVSTYQFYIGVDNSITRAFQGDIDEVRLFSGGLTPAQVAAIYRETHPCPAGPATLIGEWHFEEAAWGGKTGELKDTAGYSGGPFNGTALGSGLPVPATVSPAIAGSSGTCGYATLPGPLNGGGAFTLPALPVSTVTGSKTSVAFWMYWDGVDGVMPIGWNIHDLWIVSGNFGFNTGNSDVYGIASAGLAKSWHHVVAVFINGGVTSNKLYVDGVDQVLTQRASTPNLSTAVVASTLQAGGWTRDSGYRFSGRLDELKVYTGAVTQTQVTALYKETHSCTVTSVLPANFNCVESGAAASTGHLYTKLAGTGFSFDVVALKTDGTVETAYASGASRPVTVELVDGSGSTTCSSRTVINPAVSQTLTFVAANAGRQAAASMTVAKAYPDLRCRVTDANQSPSVVGCSSDDFAVRPSSLMITSSASADAAGLGNSASPAIKTGANFSLTAGSGVVGYNLAPKFDTSKLAAHSGAVQTGTLAGSFGNADPLTGTATGSTFSYSEVGYFRLGANGVYDDSFTSVDAAAGDCTADFSNAAVSGKVGCKFGNVAATNYFGRFLPDHFDVTTNSNGAMAAACLAGGFTYTGQSMSYASVPALTISPMNAATGGGVTQNYQGSFQKLSATGVTFTMPVNDLTQLGQPMPPASTAPTKTALDTDTAKTKINVGTLTNSNGVMTYTLSASDKFTYKRESNALVSPYINAIALAVSSVTDSEVSDAGSLPTLLPTGVSMRFGRLRLQNAYGSEKLALRVPLQAQYYLSNPANPALVGYFTNNAADSCTPVSAPVARTLTGSAKPDGIANLYFYPLVTGKNQLLSTDAVPTLPASLSAGQANLQFSAPGKQGWLDVILSVPDHLTYNWGNCNGQGADTLMNDLPCARATFGVYGSKSPIIYRRENY